MELNPFHNRADELALYQPMVGCTMLELGSKVNAPFKIDPRTGVDARYTYKAYFESLGFKHISIDWNGAYGAIKRDLSKPLWDELGQFDMLSNMGTTEHVTDQRGCWRNIHHLTKTDGVYVGQTPYHDGKSWWWHGEHYPTEAFYESFAELNGWQIERMYVGRDIPNQNLYVRMRKVHDLSFTMPDEKLIHYNQRRPR